MTSPIGIKSRPNNFRKSHGFTPLEKSFLTGFTLIELILVILLISVLVGLSTPLFKRTFSDLQLKDASFNIVKTINYAQEMAIIGKTNYRLNFNPEKGKYWLTKYIFSEEKCGYERISGKYGKTFSLPEGLTIISDNDTTTFYPDGRSEESKIKIINKNREGLLLEVKGFGSKVEIKEIENE